MNTHTLQKAYERLHSMTLQDYQRLDKMQSDLDEVVRFIEEAGLVQTLGPHVNGVKVYYGNIMNYEDMGYGDIIERAEAAGFDERAAEARGLDNLRDIYDNPSLAYDDLEEHDKCDIADGLESAAIEHIDSCVKYLSQSP